MPVFPELGSGSWLHHQLPELAQTHLHRVGDAIQPSHPLSSPFPPAFNHNIKYMEKNKYKYRINISM